MKSLNLKILFSRKTFIIDKDNKATYIAQISMLSLKKDIIFLCK